jgi:hypothetical protein
MKVLDLERAEKLLEYMRHAESLLDPHPRLSALQLRQEMERVRSTVQGVRIEIEAAVTTGKHEAELAKLEAEDIF